MIANFTLTYAGVPFNDILVIQNAIDKVGYIDGLRVQYMNVTSNDGLCCFSLFFFADLLLSINYTLDFRFNVLTTTMSNDSNLSHFTAIKIYD